MSLQDPETPEQGLARIIHPAFKKDGFRVDRSRPIVFVCGGNRNTALRNQFLSHVPKSQPPILAILAEHAFPHQLIERNLQLFEAFLADTADCVLIFVESVGSYAETGLFAALKAVIGKTFIVNTKKASQAPSFLNQGPIKLIRRNSEFDEVFVLDKKLVRPADAKNILSTITRVTPRYSTPLTFDLKTRFSDLNLRLQIAAVYMAVVLIRAGTVALFTDVLRTFFKAVETDKIQLYLSLLVNFGVILRKDDIYYRLKDVIPLTDLFIAKQSFRPEVIKALTLEWHIKHSVQTEVFLREHGIRQ